MLNWFLRSSTSNRWQHKKEEPTPSESSQHVKTTHDETFSNHPLFRLIHKTFSTPSSIILPIVHAEEPSPSETSNKPKKPSADEIFRKFLEQAEAKHAQNPNHTFQPTGQSTLSGTTSKPSLTTLNADDLEGDEIFARVQRKYHLKNIYKLMSTWTRCSQLPRNPLDDHPYVTDPRTLETIHYACSVGGMIDEEEVLDLTHHCLPSAETLKLVTGPNASQVDRDEAEDIIRQCNDCLNGRDVYTQQMKQVYIETKDLMEERNSLKVFLPKVSSLLNLASETQGLKEGSAVKSRNLFAVDQHHDNNKKIVAKIHWAQLKIFQSEFSELSRCLHDHSGEVQKCKFETTNYMIQSRAVACSNELSYCLDHYDSIVSKLQDYQKRHTKTGLLVGFGGEEDEDKDSIFGGNEYEWGNYEDDDARKKKPKKRMDEDEVTNEEKPSTINNSYSSSSSKSVTSGIPTSDYLLKASQKQQSLKEKYDEVIFVGNHEQPEEMTTENVFDLDDELNNEGVESIKTTTMEKFTKCMTLYQPVIKCVKRVEQAMKQQLAKAQRKNQRKKKKRREPTKTYEEQMYDFKMEEK